MRRWTPPLPADPPTRMTQPQTLLPAPPAERPTTSHKIKKALGPIGIGLLIVAKFFGKIKFLLIPLAKFGLPILKTGGSMILIDRRLRDDVGRRFAVGFVLLIFVHECGHLVAARRLGLNVGAPVFIPFMGAFIALKEAPRTRGSKPRSALAVRCSAPRAPPSATALLLTGNPLFARSPTRAFF